MIYTNRRRRARISSRYYQSKPFAASSPDARRADNMASASTRITNSRGTCIADMRNPNPIFPVLCFALLGRMPSSSSGPSNCGVGRDIIQPTENPKIKLPISSAHRHGAQQTGLGRRRFGALPATMSCQSRRSEMDPGSEIPITEMIEAYYVATTGCRCP